MSDDEHTRIIKTGKLYREATIEAVRQEGEDDDKRQVRIAFSSEEPVRRFFGMEILDHDKKSIDLSFFESGRAPLLRDHSPTQQIGVIESVEIGRDRIGRVIARLGKGALAEDELRDIRDGIRVNASVGYTVNKMVLEKEDKDGPDIFRITDWTPLEVSTVSVPADRTVGVGRGEGPPEFETYVFERRHKMAEPNTDPQPEPKRSDSPPQPQPGNTKPADVLKPEELESMRQDQFAKEQKRIDSIRELARRKNKQQLGEDHVRKGTSIEEFRGVLLDAMGDAEPLYHPPGDLGLSRQEQKDYSLLRVMRYLDDVHTGRRAGEQAGFELECSQEIQNRLNGEAPRGIYIPLDVQGRAPSKWRQREQRDLSVTNDSALRPTEHLAGSFIELLRDALVIRRAGARVMSGLVGDVNIPRQATGATAAWIGTEGNAATESEATFNQLQLSPKDLGVFTDVTRRLILQSDPSVEQIVREDLAQSIANGVDDAALNGTGTSGQPTGVRNTSGIGDVNLGANGGAITWGDVLEFWSDVGTANALMGRLAWIMNHQTAAKLMQVERATNTAVFLLDPERMTMVLAPVFLTELAPSNLSKGTGTNLDAIFFGNWSDLILAEWGVLDLLRDPFTASSSGTVRFRVFMTVDIGVRHAGSFSITDEFDPAA